MARLKAKKTEKNPTDSIGGKLRKAREEKGISLEEAHRSTKIHPRMLNALEEDRLENILGRTYVKAFLRNYAHYLGLDANNVLQEYAAKGTPGTAGKITFVQKPILERRRRRFSNIVIVMMAFIVWFFILGFATFKFMSHYRDIIHNKKYIIPKQIETSETVAKDIEKTLIPIPQNRTITLTLVASNDVWLKVTQDGEVAFHGILSKNSKETWRADKEIKLSEIGRPAVLKLNINGKDIDLSEKRLSKNILITHKGIDIESKP